MTVVVQLFCLCSSRYCRFCRLVLCCGVVCTSKLTSYGRDGCCRTMLKERRRSLTTPKYRLDAVDSVKPCAFKAPRHPPICSPVFFVRGWTEPPPSTVPVDYNFFARFCVGSGSAEGLLPLQVPCTEYMKATPSFVVLFVFGLNNASYCLLWAPRCCIPDSGSPITTNSPKR